MTTQLHADSFGDFGLDLETLASTGTSVAGFPVFASTGTRPGDEPSAPRIWTVGCDPALDHTRQPPATSTVASAGTAAVAAASGLVPVADCGVCLIAGLVEPLAEDLDFFFITSSLHDDPIAGADYESLAAGNIDLVVEDFDDLRRHAAYRATHPNAQTATLYLRAGLWGEAFFGMWNLDVATLRPVRPADVLLDEQFKRAAEAVDGRLGLIEGWVVDARLA